MSTTTQQNISYYANLLILQYLQKPKALATIQMVAGVMLLGDSNIQSIIFNGTPVSGTFQLSYNGSNTVNINWNDSASTIQSDLNSILISPLSVIVSGSISSGLIFTFNNNTSAILNLLVQNNLLLNSFGSLILASIVPIGDQLPDEIQNAFNLIGPNYAVGNQLDIIAKYVGVSRSGSGAFGPITLDDSDFLKFIQLGIVKNNSGSSLYKIQLLLNQYFAGEILIFDYANMNMSYLINTSIIGENLLQLFVNEKLLPRPMGVGLSIVAAPVINKFFAFRTYDAPAWANTTAFTTYDLGFDTSSKWLSYDNGI